MPPLETGVSQSLAKWRSANYSDVRYKLNITLEKGASLMKGEIEIRVNLTDEGAKENLILDWRTTQFANDKDKPFANVLTVNKVYLPKAPDSGTFDYAIDKEHIIISKKFLQTGENFIKIEFASPIKTSGAAVTRYVDKEDGAEYIYSLFVPSDASTAFPVFDQPDLKAKFQLNIKVPYRWKVVTNSAEEDYAATIVDENNKPVQDSRHFETTKPISSYVFAFAAGEFQEFTGERHIDAKYPPDLNVSLETRAPAMSRNSTTNIYVRKSQAEKFKPHEKEVFRLNREGVKFLEEYFDYKFPFPKYDLVLIPEFPFNGMEHAGATFIRESSIIFPTEPTKNDYVSRANVMFHEAAHQWFGDTVTMKWFDDLWLKEGFAEFMAYKTLEKVMPEYNAWKIFYERNKQAAYLTDSTKGTTPIYQEIPNLSSAKSAYGNIVYRKAPSFLKQAEFYLGEKEFQTAVRAFLKKHEFANAGWQDLVKEFETSSKQDLKDWANVWVKERGIPIISVIHRCDDYCHAMFFQRNIVGEKANWLQKIKILLIKDDNREIREIRLGLKDKDFPDVFLGTNLNDVVFPNYQDYGYGIFLLDAKSRAYVVQNIQTEKDDFLRAMMWGSLWDSVREGELAPQEYVTLVIKNLSVETDESTIQTLLGRTATALNYYIDLGFGNADFGLKDNQTANPKSQIRNPKSNGADLSRRLENLLIEKMQNAQTAGQKITFYRAFLNVASSENARNVLKEMLKQSVSSPTVKEGLAANPAKTEKPALTLGLPTLRTKDRFDIVTRLLILGDEDAPKLLADLEKTETSDEAKRYAYAAKAGIATAENKAKFWNDFVNNKEISESWIEAAFVVFNSPKHSQFTLPYLEKALTELPNLKRNRKIFFVNGWLASFIGGQKSEEALKIINDFLAKNPNLDKDLRLKILENADIIERAVKIRAKFGK